MGEKITVMGSTTNGNTFDVTFNDGKVNVRFASGNFFTNFFRSRTLSRFTQTLQAQYDTRLDEQAQIEQAKAMELAQTLGFTDNPNADKVAAVVDEFKAFINEANPADKARLNGRLDDLATLAAIRNTLTRIPNGAACNEKVAKKCQTHFNDYVKEHAEKGGPLDEKTKKAYILNTIDTIINGFLEVAAQMKDKKTQAVEFARILEGACMEAKNDNIQNWLGRAAGVINVARSDESKDLAYSINAEFNVIAKEVRKPFEDAARAECEADVRADCAKQGITDEEIIKDTIETRVQQILIGKDDEIQPKIRKAIEEQGKFFLYEALVGAKRPMTEISKDEETKMWTVTKLVDKKGEPIMKPVSAYDIDNIFPKMVDMFMEGAMTMGMVVNETRTAEDITFASLADLRGDAVVALAEKYATGEVDKAELARLVKAEIPFAADIPEVQFAEHREMALGDITALKHDDPVKAKKQFSTFALHYTNGAYFDKTNDLGRLVHLLASRTATLASPEKKFLAGLDGMAIRCAQMMRNAYPDYRVSVVRVKTYIITTLKALARERFHGKAESAFTKGCKQQFDYLVCNGILFSDNVIYDLGHRAAGNAEVLLHEALSILKQLIRRFANAPMSWYLTKLNGAGEM